jgi:hypothetical protein
MLENKISFAYRILAFAFILSAFASILQANAILSTGNLNCTFAMANGVNTDCGPGGNNIALVSSLPQQSNNIAGVSYSLSNTLTDTSAGTKKPFDTILTLSTSGGPTGSGVGAVPVIMGWDFTLALVAAIGNTRINNWTLTFDLRDLTAGNVSLFSSLPTITSGALSIDNTTPVRFTGMQAFNMSSITPGDTLKQTSMLTVNWTGQNSQDNLSIQFAQYGLDFNDSPEPATYGLIGGALAVVVRLARRKRGNKPRI